MTSIKSSKNLVDDNGELDKCYTLFWKTILLFDLFLKTVNFWQMKKLENT